jgi:hypothetical protein
MPELQSAVGRVDDMKSKKRAAPARASSAEKMLELKIKFWTNQIACKGKAAPKPGWAFGVVRIEASGSPHIDVKRPRHFGSFLELPSVIEQVLTEHGVVLAPKSRTRKPTRQL